MFGTLGLLFDTFLLVRDAFRVRVESVGVRFQYFVGGRLRVIVCCA